MTTEIKSPITKSQALAITRAVARGAKWLDENYPKDLPKWYGRTGLKISQIDESWSQRSLLGLLVIRTNIYAHVQDLKETIRLGFLLPQAYCNKPGMSREERSKQFNRRRYANEIATNAWKAEIRRRRAA